MVERAGGAAPSLVTNAPATRARDAHTRWVNERALTERLKSVKTKLTLTYTTRRRAATRRAIRSLRLLLPSPVERMSPAQCHDSSQARRTNATLLSSDGPKSREQLGEQPSSSRATRSEMLGVYGTRILQSGRPESSVQVAQKRRSSESKPAG